MALDQVLFGGLLLACYAASNALGRFKKTMRARQLHLAQVAFSMGAGSCIFGITSMAGTLVLAVIVWLIQQRTWESKSYIIWLSTFSTLITLHLTRGAGWHPHITGSIMLMVIKYTSLSHESSCGLIEWLGWTFFIPSFFTGPTLSLAEYMAWVDDDDEKPTEQDGTHQILTALWYVPFVLFGQRMFPASQIASFPVEMNLFDRVMFAALSMWCIRARYYLAWSIAHACYLASGASAHTSHEGCNVDPWEIETATSVHQVTKNWNRCTSDWLKNSVHRPLNEWLRQRNVRSAGLLAVIGTNVVSAAWHGLHPGYYLTFVGAGLCTIVGRLLHRNVESRLSGWMLQVYKIVSWVWCFVILVTFTIPFQVYTLDAGWMSWEAIYFIGHFWMVAAACLALAIGPPKPSPPDKEE